MSRHGCRFIATRLTAMWMAPTGNEHHGQHHHWPTDEESQQSPHTGRVKGTTRHSCSKAKTPCSEGRSANGKGPIMREQRDTWVTTGFLLETESGESGANLWT